MLSAENNLCLRRDHWSQIGVSLVPGRDSQLRCSLRQLMKDLKLEPKRVIPTSGSQDLASPTSTAVDRAMHRWPAAPKAAPTI